MFSSVWMLQNIPVYYEVSCKCKYIHDKCLLSFITHSLQYTKQGSYYNDKIMEGETDWASKGGYLGGSSGQYLNVLTGDSTNFKM
jgi:hypothetical protein